MADQPLVSTPGYLQDRARQIHAAALSLNDDLASRVRAGALPNDAPQLQAWRAWRDAWGAWYGDTTATTWLWGATGETLDEYAQALNRWRDWYRAAFGVAPSMVPGVADPDAPSSSGRGWLYALGGLGVGIAVAIAMRK